MRITRFYFEGSLKTDSIVKLHHDLTHYVVKVLRLKTGNQIKLFKDLSNEVFIGIDHDMYSHTSKLTDANKKALSLDFD